MPPATTPHLILPFLLLVGCATDEADVGATAQACGEQIGQWIDFQAPPRPTPDDHGYPHDDAGRSILSRAGNVTLAFDPDQRNPVMTFSGCNWWLMRCYEEHGNLDDCYLSAPRCEGDTPWLDDQLCCPQGCYDDYAQR